MAKIINGEGAINKDVDKNLQIKQMRINREAGKKLCSVLMRHLIFLQSVVFIMSKHT